MKKILLPIIAVSLGAMSLQAQVLRAFAPRYSNASVKGNITQVANNIITSTGGYNAANPGNTNELPPGGTSRNNNSLGRSINIEAMVPFGSSWKYLGNNGAQPGGWNTLAFIDAAWPTGNGEFGYGDGDEVTCVPSGGGGTLCQPTGNKDITTYFRKIINIPNPLAFTGFRFKVERDDGYVLYVNGVEVSRDNMPAGIIAHTTVASADVNDAVITVNVPNTTFAAGNNIIAVEVHNRAANNTDLSFDLELAALTGSSNDIFNSSSADLNLPSCSQILYAGLYWGATQGNDGTNVTWRTGETGIKIKVPGSAVYQNVTSSQTDYHDNVMVPSLGHTGYRCFANITSLLNATNPNGTYTIANMCVPEGIANAAGGWSIVIAYSDPSTIIRNLTIFDGSAIMNGSDPPLDVTFSGFLTPPTGPVSCELGAIVYDGDRTSLDAYKFNGGSGFIDLTPNATSNLSDMWNSTISKYGANVTTRNPAHSNTLGYDADILEVPNVSNAVLGNNASTATVRFESPSENYMIQVLTTAISQYTPTFNFSKNAIDVNGGTLQPGDIIRYQLNYQNTGNDASTATTIVDNIPVGTTYKPGSLVINGTSKTDNITDDEAEYDVVNNRVLFRLGAGANGSSGGEVDPGISGNITFEVYTPRSCQVLACNNTINNRARIAYGGKKSLLNLQDSSGVILAGCNNPNPATSSIVGACSPLGDTILTNICPVTTVTLPVAMYGGYTFYTAMPFTGATRYNPANPITFTRIVYAFYDGPGACDDTININVHVMACPDIDDDNDGIPDYVEIAVPLAWADHDGDGILNWNDAQYPGYVDNNFDNFNDNFDPGADSDGDGIPNFYDVNFPGYVDTNGDGVHDLMDKDLDGIPNHLDLDSDNDGIPDTVESFGVDANGDGLIDNYTDTDNDGLSQNVDGSGGGVTNSGLALGPLDTDGDGVPNFLDLDSDNDGIPDAREVFGTDSNNDGRIDGFTDSDGDGYGDTIDGDVGNDNIAENSSASLLRTSTDGNNDGRLDTWPYNNMDGDSKSNPYDLDSDGDGITDVKEAQFPDTNWDGRVDGALNLSGWNNVISGMGSLSLINTDGVGRPNLYDIDSDDDGIPDNVEGMTTAGYLLPGITDTDSDGIIDTYDNFNGFGGDGIHPADKDADTTPDYLDSDTDGDGLVDIIEGNDLNLNDLPDDLVTLTGVDTDGDGLDDRFDANNSSAEATSARMGNGGSFTGDATPGSITTVQRSTTNSIFCPTERDWRCVSYILSCDIISFKASLQNNRTDLRWEVLCKQEADHFEIERSTDYTNFISVANVAGRSVINELELYTAADNVSQVRENIIYYRLKTVMRNGTIKYGNIIAVKRSTTGTDDVQILPNPVRDQFQLLIISSVSTVAQIQIINSDGQVVHQYKEKIATGSNTLVYRNAVNLTSGVYYVRIMANEVVLTKKFSVIK
jgi:uncharacterized repeat protein (TIGR01451 family)